MDATLIESLKNPTLYDHPVTRFELFETHSSWVLLTGEYAYKIKKPVDFGFLDFSTLEKRKFCCEEEIRLNKRFAPQLYQGVVPLYGSPAQPSFQAGGEPIEYTVKMKQFKQKDLLTHVLERNELTPEAIDQLADSIAAFHLKIPPIPNASPNGTAEAVLYPVTHNFRAIEPLLTDLNDKERLSKHESWAKETHQALYSIFEKRKQEGFIRECHGDMHLGNIAWIDGTMTLFDCIEFNKPYYCIDMISDLAFLMMDLQSRSLPEYANQLLNRYLEHTGDYNGLILLPFYAAYRAMVRAKVSILRLNQPGIDPEERRSIYKRYREYVSLAESYTKPQKGHLMIMHGLSGSGKSVCSAWFAGKLNAIRLRSDVERKRLFGLSRTAISHQYGADIYTHEASEKTFKRIAEQAVFLCQLGFSVIVDATFLKQSHRASFHGLADTVGVPFHILECAISRAQAKEWLSKRQGDSDPSEATPNVLEKQQVEPIAQTEKPFTIRVIEMNVAAWENALQKLTPGLSCAQTFAEV